jgi:hypothetical protein
MKSMAWVRIGLPVAIIVAGIIAAAASGFSEDGLLGGASIVGAGLAVWLLNFFFRVGVAGDRERDAEDRARQFYDEHGYWPDEQPPAPQSRADPHRHPDPAAHLDSPHGRRRRR